jgi:two-component system nitrogen regulation response regulator GlnG
VKVIGDPLGGLLSTLNEARDLAYAIQCRSRPAQDPPPAIPEEVGRLGSDLLSLVGLTDLPVLLWGAAGSTAAPIARFIHDHSLWRGGAFLSLRAVSLQRGDIQTTLGRVGWGNGQSGHVGTVYFDEITNLVPEVQEELRACLGSVGDGLPWSNLPFRLIASTGRSVEGALQDGTLSESLYFQIAPIILPIPPSETSRPIPITERSLGTWIVAELQRLRGTQDGDLHRHFFRLLQRSLLPLVLERTGGNQLRAARLLGVNRNTLRNWMRLLEGAA